MKVRKRKGEVEDFDIIKIAKAIYKARVDSGERKELEDCVREAKQVVNDLPEDTDI